MGHPPLLRARTRRQRHQHRRTPRRLGTSHDIRLARRGDEPGIEVLSFHQGEQNTFWFFALLTDRAAIRQHREHFAARDFIAEFDELVEIKPRISITAPMAAIGLDLDLEEPADNLSKPGAEIHLT